MVSRRDGSRIVDPVRPRIGFAALSQPGTGHAGSCAARDLREGLRKVADVVDVGSAGEWQDWDAVLLVDCVLPVREPYFVYLDARQDSAIPADPSAWRGAAGLFATDGCVAHNFAVRSGIPRRKIHHIPSALSRRVSSRDMPPLAARPAPRGKALYLTTCQNERQQAVTVRLLLNALEILRQDYGQPITLTIAGLERWPLPVSPPEYVSFHGDLPTAEMIDLVDQHDLHLVPPGAAAFAIPEALSRGIPCVAACSGEMADAIIPGVSGALVDWPFGDGADAGELAAAMAATLASDEIYRRCRERAPAMAAYFSWERVARQITHVIAAEIGLII